MSTATYALTGLHCNACVGRVTKKLEPLAESVEVTLNPMQVVLTNPQADFGTLQSAVTQAGAYGLVPPAAAPVQTGANTAWRDDPAWGDDPAAAPASWFATYRPLLLIVGYILGASVVAQLAYASPAVTLDETMRLFMAGFFLVFSFFKLLDVNAFADAYAGYDLLARRWRGWGLIYPFVELALGLAYLADASPVLTAWATIAVMGFSAIGVIQAVTSKRQIRCACLGAVFQLPMSTVTIVEDLGMVAMAIWMLAIHL